MKTPRISESRRPVGGGWFLPASLVLVLLLGTAGLSTAAQRNILVLIADDYGMDSHSLYNTTSGGATLPPTTNLNALLQSGVLFRNAYANATCSPTRAALLTGRYGFRTGVNTALASAATIGIYTNEYTLPEVLRANPALGYHSSAFGKWHLGSGNTGPSVVGGWTNYAGGLGGALASYTNWNKVVNGSAPTANTNYPTTDVVNDAVAWIQARGTNNWLAWVAFNAAHTPFHKPPTNLCPQYAGLPGTQIHINNNPRLYYEASVQALDLEIGRLLNAVNRTNTDIIFLGDNGTPGQVIQPPYTQLRAKGTLYEGGTRVPMIIAGPDIVSPNRTNDAVVHAVDLYATILELSGVNLAQALPLGLTFDSRSLVPILHNQTFAPAEGAVLMQESEAVGMNQLPGRAARRGDHKLIQFTNSTEEFYNVATDPTEATNLLLSPLTTTQQSALDALRASLSAWQNTPVLTAPQWSGGQFRADAGWFVNARLALERSTNLTATNWLRLTNATVQDRGFTIRLTDPAAAISNGFYRVLAE